MKKSLNDSLREEFKNILQDGEVKQLVEKRNLESSIIKGAFEKLLASERFLDASEQDIDKARSEFENYILNTLKTKHH